MSEPSRSPRTARHAALGRLGRAGATCLLFACACRAAAGEDHVVYRTRPGDTLIGIGEQLLARPTDCTELQRANGIVRPSRMGQDLALRVPVRLLRRTAQPATLDAVAGEATSNGQPAVAGMPVREGAELATQEDGSLTLVLADGSRLTLQPQSRLRLERHRSLPAGLGVDSRISLPQGRVEAQKPASGSRSPQRLELPAAVISVRGTHYRASAAPDTGRSGAEVTAGRVAVSARSTTRVLDQGYGLALAPGAPLPPPVRLLPAPDLSKLAPVYETTAPGLAFAPLAGAVAYRAQLATDAGFERIVAERRAGGAPLKLPTPHDGEFWLRLRGIDRLGIEGFDAVARLRVAARPEPPFPSTPPDGAKLRGEPPRFSWSASTEAQAYAFQLAGDPAFATAIDAVEGIEASEYRPAAALPPGDYWWRVASLAGDGRRGPWSGGQRLLVRPAPAAPEPPAIDADSVEFGWTGEPGQGFEFELAADARFAQILVARRLDAPQIRLARPQPGVYYMRVRATDADGYVGPYTAAQRFEVPAARPWWLLLLLLLLVPAL
jgi:hypothetical protein